MQPAMITGTAKSNRGIVVPLGRRSMHGRTSTALAGIAACAPNSLSEQVLAICWYSWSVYDLHMGEFSWA